MKCRPSRGAPWQPSLVAGCWGLRGMSGLLCHPCIWEKLCARLVVISVGHQLWAYNSHWLFHLHFGRSSLRFSLAMHLAASGFQCPGVCTFVLTHIRQPWFTAVSDKALAAARLTSCKHTCHVSKTFCKHTCHVSNPCGHLVWSWGLPPGCALAPPLVLLYAAQHAHCQVHGFWDMLCVLVRLSIASVIFVLTPYIIN